MSHPPSKYPNDAQQSSWLRLTRQGQAAAFSHIVERYQKPVYNLCYRMLNDAVAAEDAAQEVFLRAYAKLDSYDERRQFSTWLFAIASNYCLDQLKRRRLNLVAWDELTFQQHPTPAETTHPEAVALKSETTREIQALLAALPVTYRTVVVLKYWHHLSYEEMAHTLDTTVSAIKSKLFRARKLLTAEVDRRAVQPTVYHGQLALALG